MEETNYHRVESSSPPPTSESVDSGTSQNSGASTHVDENDNETEKPPPPAYTQTLSSPAPIPPPIAPDEIALGPSRKTFIQKMALFQRGTFRRRNKLWRMIVRPLIFLRFPVIFYAGFCYGSNLVVSNFME